MVEVFSSPQTISYHQHNDGFSGPSDVPDVMCFSQVRPHMEYDCQVSHGALMSTHPFTSRISACKDCILHGRLRC